jgi:hypothetical protein
MVDSSHRTGMLGDISPVERPLYTEAATPRRPRRERGALPVRVTFETHRLATIYLATAYEQAVPFSRRGRRIALAAAPTQADQRPAARAGA